MARKTLSDMTGIASTIARSGAKPESPQRSGAPALGALQGALTAIRELEPALIDDWGPKDRFDEFTAVNEAEEESSFATLKQSIKTDGQQVPILVRRAGEGPRYEVIYGRRRLRACRELGLKVRANVQDMDDATALLAKGLENAARRNLSFYEKARFAEAILDAGYDSAAVRKTLGLSASGLSHLTKVTSRVPELVGDLIGPAPKAGRPKWTALADIFSNRQLTEHQAVAILGEDMTLPSDARLDRLLKEAGKRGARPGGGAGGTELYDGVTLKKSRGSVTLTASKSGPNAAFGAWLENNLEDIIVRSYAQYKQTKGRG